MLNKVLVANRGEIAVRIIRACQELGIETVAVYSDVDVDALHVYLADEAHHIGPPPATQSYLDGTRLIDVALSTGCDSIHPGYGFLSEAPAFARAVRAEGLIFIGPGADAIAQMGVKTEARQIMAAAGVPVVPGFQSRNATIDDFQQEAQHIGYPVMVKAAGGGGGKGIRIVPTPKDLPDAIESARREAHKAFNDATVFIEKYIANGRHIEVQVLADAHGNTIHLYERECSVQRRHQKIIEESPSPFISDSTRFAIGETAVTAAQAVGYENAGTVEFIVAEDETFYFLEMNTRLQVEHPVTELVTGIDLVQAQLRIASGEHLWLAQEDVRQRGHTIEARIYAEDPANNFLPAVGHLHHLIEPQGPGIRVDSGLTGGSTVTIHYDPLLAKLITYSHTRSEAIRKMDWALSQFIILGLTTNIQFLRDIMQHPIYELGEATTHFVDDYMPDWEPQHIEPGHAALIGAALHDYFSVQTKAAATASSPDPYSPWNQQDTFRIG